MQEPNGATSARNELGSISRIEQEILGLEEVNRQAEMRSDLKTVANTWADDYVLTTPLGTVIEKAAILASIQPGATSPELDSYAKEDFKLQVCENTALANFRLVAKGQYAGTAFEHRWRITNVWMNQNGRWQIKATQITPISDACKTA